MIIHNEEFSDVFNNRYFQHPRKLLVGIGHWPYVPRMKKYLFRFIFLGALLNGVPFEIKEFINRWRTDKNASMYCVPPLLTQALCMVKYSNFIINETQIRALLSDTYENWKITGKEAEREILMTYSEYARSMSKLYAACLYIAMVFFLIMPLSPAMLDMVIPLNESRPKRLVFPVDFGVPTDDYYIYLVLHAYVGAFSAITIIVASDVFFVCLVCHASHLFAVTRHCLEHINDDIIDCTAQRLHFKLSEINGSHTATKVCVKRVAYGVICHNKALKYSDLLENSFTWSLFVILGINMIIISLTAFQVLTQKDRWDDVLTSVTYIFGQLCHLFLLSLPGQLLIDESGSIHSSVNKSYSFEVPVKAQKMLIPILIRSMRTSRITAGKFFILEMETFMTVLKASVSYFTVLANFC